MEILCKHCDVFIGYGGVGVVERPKGKTAEWLESHCWMCSKSKEEVIEENQKRSKIGTNYAG